MTGAVFGLRSSSLEMMESGKNDGKRMAASTAAQENVHARQRVMKAMGRRGSMGSIIADNKKSPTMVEDIFGAADRDRTGDLLLGKETFYH